MSRLTCAEAAAQIDLYAAGECAEPLASALREHLQDCLACARSYQEALHLQGLLGLHFQEAERFERLGNRLAVEDRPILRLPRRFPFVRQVVALAAMLLLVVFLSRWLGPAPNTLEEPVPQLALGRLHPEQWPVTVLGGGREMMKPAMVGSKGRGPEENSLRVAPGARWKALGPRKIQLFGGIFLVEVRKQLGPRVGPLEIETPLARIIAAGGKYLIEVQPFPEKEMQRPLVYLSVIEGRARFANAWGGVTGYAGDVLWTRENEAPRRRGSQAQSLGTKKDVKRIGDPGLTGEKKRPEG